MIAKTSRILAAPALAASLIATGAAAQTVPQRPIGAAAATAPSPAGGNDDKIKQLEAQLQQQQEQNRQILEALKQMQQGQPQATPAASIAGPPPAAPPPKKEDAKFTHGWVARILPVGADIKTIPADELGHFVAEKESYRLGDFSKEAGIRSGVDAGWKGEAFLEVTEAGRHTFSLNFIQDNPRNTFGWSTPCWGSILVEGQSVAQGINILNWPNASDKNIKSVVGGADLEPGRYKVEFWGACGEEIRGVATAAADPNALRAAMNVTFEMMVKRPSDAGPVSANKALVVKIQKS